MDLVEYLKEYVFFSLFVSILFAGSSSCLLIDYLCFHVSPLFLLLVHFFLVDHTKVKVKVTQLCQTLCDSVDCSLPGSSVHGII